MFSSDTPITALSISGQRTSLNGWEGSVEGKVLPFIGIVGGFHSVTTARKISDFATSCPVLIPNCVVTFSTNFREHNYLFGPRVSVSVGKIRPFAEALFGAGHIHVNGGPSDTSFATAVGGGIDYKILKYLRGAFREITCTRLCSSSHQSNVRISTGIVVRF